mmetsp:Transcript_13987/g.23688  ORF Transcript_13987/g.23688 Transcript_13987/m.23688 type:complete len:213 (-) Transcript_13987:277-915(-)|eukprot:CAMPEP_0198201474 /NCGR_PEP_ID=MMETSP1445-20131203/4345_1 /TAXON_ID=36898 /ORGANISM="Pyramimonas sp., Strain CCMP2087" /LENGTH=212 /DNA_ID=CAMNT_0043871855 /DNA_START=406 /DNA_END=1044 /DNA_ORIENTATION=+
MDWSKTRTKYFSEFKNSKRTVEHLGRGPRMVDADFTKTLPWTDPKDTGAARKFQSDAQISYGPRYTVRKVEPHVWGRPGEEASVRDAWRQRHQDAQGRKAGGVATERPMDKVTWREKLGLPNDKLPPVSRPELSERWRTTYTDKHSPQDRIIINKTRLFPAEGVMDKVTTTRPFGLREEIQPFMSQRLDAQYKPLTTTKLGAFKTKSNFVFG